jgi:hypothetical protein
MPQRESILCGILSVRNIFQNILHPAVQHLAKVVKGGGGDIFIVLERMEGSAAEVKVVNKGIGSNAL